MNIVAYCILAWIGLKLLPNWALEFVNSLPTTFTELATNPGSLSPFLVLFIATIITTALTYPAAYAGVLKRVIITILPLTTLALATRAGF